MPKNVFLNDYMRARFGCKVYKLALNAGMTCPNRDGKLGYGGCLFCSEGGSGEFAGPAHCSIAEQMRRERALLASKVKNCRQVKYFSYFQAFTNTYAPVEKLRSLYMQAIEPEDIVGLSIATRPDELPPEVLSLLSELVRESGREIWVELGLQTIHESTARYIRRGYSLACFESALENLQCIGVKTVVHVIFGLPGETRDDMLSTVRYLSRKPIFGIKFQNLQVLRGTGLEEAYRQGKFVLPAMEEYTALVRDSLKILPARIVIHRITGDPPRKLLIAPAWCLDKRRVMNACLKDENII